VAIHAACCATLAQGSLKTELFIVADRFPVSVHARNYNIQPRRTMSSKRNSTPAKTLCKFGPRREPEF
jgi:hypothetical protein